MMGTLRWIAWFSCLAWTGLASAQCPQPSGRAPLDESDLAVGSMHCLVDVDASLCRNCKSGWKHRCGIAGQADNQWHPVEKCLRGELRRARQGEASKEAMAAMSRRQSRALSTADESAVRHQVQQAEMATQLGRMRAQTDHQQQLVRDAQQRQALQRMNELAERQAAETAFLQMRQQQIDEANATEDANRRQWEAGQREAQVQALAQQQAAQQANERALNSAGRPPEQNARPRQRQRPAPVIRPELSHTFSHGGISGRTPYFNVHIANRGNVPIDCDVSVRGSFWNERAGPALPTDEGLANIKTQRGHVIGLKPAEKRRVLALTHFVDGSHLTYKADSCRVSFTYEP